jgi:hypothetical protein
MNTHRTINSECRGGRCSGGRRDSETFACNVLFLRFLILRLAMATIFTGHDFRENRAGFQIRHRYQKKTVVPKTRCDVCSINVSINFN